MAIDIAEALWLATHMPADALEQAAHDGPVRGLPSHQQSGTLAGYAAPDAGALLPRPAGPGQPEADTSPMYRGAAQGSYAAGRFSLPDIAHAREMSRALKPLRTTVPSPSLSVLDEELTAEGVAALQGLWLPVVRPAPERAFDLVLMVDGHSSMAPWQQTVSELRQVLHSLGAFRNIRDVPLDLAATQDAPVDLLRLARPTNSRQLVLLATDGLADAWRDGRMAGPLHDLAATQLLSIVHMMHASAWSSSHLQGRRTAVRHSGALARSNAEWTLEDSNGAQHNGAVRRAHVAIPVITLEERFLQAWATFMAGKCQAASLPTLILPSSGQDSFRASPPLHPTTASVDPGPDHAPTVVEARLKAHLQPEEFSVARILAAVPLTDAYMRAALQEVAPDLELFLPSALSGLLAAGAVVSVTGSRPSHAPAQAAAFEPLDFITGLRAELLAHAPTSETARAMSAAHQLLRHGDVWTSFDAAALADPKVEHPTVTPDNLRRAEMSAAVFTALSGGHTSLGRKLTRAAQAVRTSPPAQPPPTHRRPAARLPAQRSRSQPRPGRTRWDSVPPRNRYFTGRPTQLALLQEMLTPGHFTEVAVLGMAGVGKTQLVTEYVYRHRHDYDLIWWISPQQAQGRGLHDGYRRLADRLAFDGFDLDGDDPVTAAIEALREGAAADRWLLVLDGASSAASTRPLLPVDGPGHVIITSRDPRWELEQDAIHLDVFDRSESIALLAAHNPRLTPAETQELARDLGDLPQAVADASRMLAETGMPVDNYRRPASFLAAASRSGTHPAGVTGAWAVTLDRLRDQDPPAYALLQVCAWLDDAPVSRALLPGLSDLPRQPDFPELDPLHGDLLGPYLAIRELNRAAIVRVNERDGTLTTHRLVRQAVLDRMDDREKRVSQRAAHFLLAARIPPPGTYDQEYRQLAPHFLASGTLESDEPEVQKAIVAMVQCLARYKDYDAARSLGEAASVAWSAGSRSSSWTVRRELRRELRRLPKLGPIPRQDRPTDPL
ncbi:FxSxx-COOH system tetratricopeptide repeat protein [Streptomyces sp. NPDC002599]|uniref:FxSxx-COOH system tetratricopeptide repeat protein n=1 Tax=Streptomyces sp. NPDC002599 TaxID=3154421 RepID=UPI003323D1AE